MKPLKNKTFWIAFLVIYLVAQVLGYLVHELWLADTYQALAGAWRPEAEIQDMMWIMFLTAAVYIFFFCLIFALGFGGGSVKCGMKYGLLIGLFMAFPMAFDQYVIYPITLELALIWAVSALVMFVIYGGLLAALYKPEKPSNP